MATVKALESRTAHQIQSGQVIVDLCSVVKELVENSLDAGATSIEVRFKNNGLDCIEVQDNGSGISSENYGTIALKHYTSKLSNYDDLSSLQTFGFRGEALSSLCALSKFHVTTARADEVPRGTRLDFEVSGRLKGTHVISCPKGTTVAVEDLFMNLPVRRRELEKNLKREYGKVLVVLQAYACISTQARISVSNLMAKGKRAVVFATKSNQTTRENIANVFGTKALTGLVAMNLCFEMQPTKNYNSTPGPENKQVQVIGHVSRPIFGEGRQAPDRQMFFVNARPCALPQVAKVFNEVYKSYNVAQSPFIFANITLDTNAYDVNVSPDKRTILLHDQASLLESLRVCLTDLFEKQDQTVPHSQKPIQKLPSFISPSFRRESSNADEAATFNKYTIVRPSESHEASASENENLPSERAESTRSSSVTSLIGNFAGRDSRQRFNKPSPKPIGEKWGKALSKDKQRLVKKLGREDGQPHLPDDYEDAGDQAEYDAMSRGPLKAVDDFNQRVAEQQPPPPPSPTESHASSSEESSHEGLREDKELRTKSSTGVVQNAFDRMRPKRNPPEVATITIGSRTTTSVLGSSSLSKRGKTDLAPSTPVRAEPWNNDSVQQKFSSSMRAFAAPGPELIKSVDRPQSKSPAFKPFMSSPTDDEELPADHSSYKLTASSDEHDQEPKQESGMPEIYGDLASEAPNSISNDAESDEEYVDEDEKRIREEAKVSELIQEAEKKVAMPSQDNTKRAHRILKGGGQKDSTSHLIQLIDASVERIGHQIQALETVLQDAFQDATTDPELSTEDASPEERLSLKISKTEFEKMHIIGQFNLGFILVTRNDTDLFIIDQHASDEKYNFERLQATTIVQNQRLVQPRILDLTAIEEEIILDNNDALLKNGFLVEISTTGDHPVGRRCKLVSLPMSREVTFDVTDLEELIALLADNPSPVNTLRPSKVRRMFAMRACRSSIMVGKTLTMKQMGALVKRMGEIDKPWNCPHGRPTMRHGRGLADWESWREGDGLCGLDEEREVVDWGGWLERRKQAQTFEEADEDEQTGCQFYENRDLGGEDQEQEEAMQELDDESAEEDAPDEELGPRQDE